jgi:general secretion pathway protein L
VSLLRLWFTPLDPPAWCRWALVNDDRDAVFGEGALADVPRHAARVQWVMAAATVLFARVRLPPTPGARTAATLAFAVEDQVVGEPEQHVVRWLGTDDGDDVLAVFAKGAFDETRAALAAAGIGDYEVHCETLLLPWQPGEWSLGWNGTDGLVRTGATVGAATDRGSADSPPVLLRMLLAQARTRGTAPAAIVLHPTVPEAVPDLGAWSRELDVVLRLAAPWDWRVAAADAGVGLGLERRRWHLLRGLATRLRPAAWIVAAVLAIHGVMLVGSWMALAGEKRALHAQMEADFRAAFPDAVAVADPVLQMRRRLADARHAAGLGDAGDFLAMVGPFADATQGLPAGSVRSVAHDGGRLGAELVGVDAGALQGVVAQLQRAGLIVETAAPAGDGAPVVITVRAP